MQFCSKPHFFRIGQALCRYGFDRGLPNGTHNDGTPTSPLFLNYGVSKLPQTIRTDLANR